MPAAPGAVLTLASAPDPGSAPGPVGTVAPTLPGLPSGVPAGPAPTARVQEIVTDPCENASVICHFVQDQTGHEWLASLANIVLTRPLPILAIVLSAALIRWLAHRAINRLVARAVAEPGSGGRLRGLARRGGLGRVRGVGVARERFTGLVAPGLRRTQRAETMGSVLRSVTTVVVYSTALVMVLGQLGVNLAPLVASVSILGVALGFGSQTLVKDVLSGVFMLLEDQYGVGDVIEACGRTGVVESVGLRTTRLRDVHGTVWHVRNGSIDDLGNFSQEWARALLDIPVAYAVDVDTAMRVIEQVALETFEDPEFGPLMLEAPEVWGVENTSASAVTIRLGVKTQPLKQWDVSRELRRRLRVGLAAAGISRAVDRAIVTFERQDAPEVADGAAQSRAAAMAAHPTRAGQSADIADALRP